MSMSLAPAHINAVRRAQDADDWTIIPSQHSVVAELHEFDRGLEVRFSKAGKCWVIYHRKHDDCPHNGTADEYLVKSIEAELSRLGVWTGLDGRVVQRMLQIQPDGRIGYRLADELEEARRKREADQKHAFREKVGEHAEELAHAIRKDMGLGPEKGRIFKPRDTGI